MVAEEVYCSIAPDGVSIFYDFFKVFYLLSSSIGYPTTFPLAII